MVRVRLKGAMGFFPCKAARYASTTSSSTLMLATEKKSSGTVSGQRGCFPNLPFGELYHMISPVGDPAATVVPILDQWVKDGRTVNYDGLLSIIKVLRSNRRYDHALEVSLWMSEKRHFVLKSRDFAIRLDLIGKVNGIEEAESYFDTIPRNLRAECYSSLLNCYVRVKDVDKAENIMQKIRDLGLARTVLAKNILLNLYYQTQNHTKLENLVREMQEEGINFNNYTFGILISAYAATSNIEGIDKLLAQIESDPCYCLCLDWTIYAVAANGYRKLGHFDKAFYLLKKSEEFITYKTRKTARTFLMTQYAGIGKKEEVMRLWNLYRKDGKIYNNGYLAIIASVLKFDDFESAEMIFEEWESRKLSFDVRIPNLLVGAYSRKGLLEAAETIINRTIMNGGKPNSWTWSYLSNGYLEHNKFSKAVEYMKEAISINKWGTGWTHFLDPLAVILEYMKDKGDMEGAEELIRLLRNNDLVSLDVHNRLMNWIKDMESSRRAIDVLDGDSNKQTNEVAELDDDMSNNHSYINDEGWRLENNCW